MDDALAPAEAEQGKVEEGVLILVVMDDALAHYRIFLQRKH